MRNAPEFAAVAIWAAFTSVIAIAQTGSNAFSSQTMANSAAQVEPLMTGRSAARTPSTGPYGALYFDPAFIGLDDSAGMRKPTSADLVAK